MLFQIFSVPFLCLIFRATALRCNRGTPVELCCLGEDRYPCFEYTGECYEGEEHVCCKGYLLQYLIGSGCRSFPGTPIPTEENIPGDRDRLDVCPAKNMRCDQKSEEPPQEPASTSPKTTAEIETEQAIEPAVQPTIDPENAILEPKFNDATALDTENNDFQLLTFDTLLKRSQRSRRAQMSKTVRI